MSGQPMEDLERAGPSMDTQRDEPVGTKAISNATTTPAGTAALVDAFVQRLQILTAVTAFLASIDGELFSLTSLSSQVTVNTSLRVQEFTYSCFSGALIFHVCATILGYVASFALIRYQLVNTASIEQSNKQDMLLSPSGDKHGTSSFNAARASLEISSVSLMACSRTSTAPLPLLTRCYYTTLVLSGLGFLAALLGITTYAWEGLQDSVGIFTVACLGASLVASIWAVL